jgi:hypothetical protein
MKRREFLILICSWSQLVKGQELPAVPKGRYIGSVMVQLLPDGNRMKLLKTLTYVDPTGTEWVAPEGSIIDGASIPQPAWSFIGGPLNGTYRDASIIHDVACERRTRSWRRVHETFYYAMLTSGVSPVKAKVMYAAVYHFGPRWVVGSSSAARPTTPSMTEQDFSRLRTLVETQERSGNELTLQQLRELQP